MDMTVPKIIVQQLGGALNMLGAYNLLGDETSLMFAFKEKAKNGIKKIRITLDPSDTYKVEFIKIRKHEAVIVSTHEDVYAEDLHDLIRRETGCETRMPRIVGLNC